MLFHTYTTIRDCTRRSLPEANDFYKGAEGMRSAQFLAQLREKARRPYYDMWPMLTRLNLDLDSSLIQLPLPALCIRFPKDPGRNPFKFDWKGEEVTMGFEGGV